MSISADFKWYLEGELKLLEQQIKVLTDRAERIASLLDLSPAEMMASWHVEELPYDPFKRNVFNVITAKTTVGKCRQALDIFGREATAREIKALIEHQTGTAPAKSIVEMLRKRAADPGSGVYRVVAQTGPAKYGLTIWKETGVRNNDGSYSPADEAIPDEFLPPLS